MQEMANEDKMRMFRQKQRRLLRRSVHNQYSAPKAPQSCPYADFTTPAASSSTPTKPGSCSQARHHVRKHTPCTQAHMRMRCAMHTYAHCARACMGGDAGTLRSGLTHHSSLPRRTPQLLPAPVPWSRSLQSAGAQEPSASVSACHACKPQADCQRSACKPRADCQRSACKPQADCQRLACKAQADCERSACKPQVSKGHVM